MADDDIAPVRACTKCNVEKPATTEFFTPQKLGLYGLTSECKPCRRQRAQAHRAGAALAPRRNEAAASKKCSQCGTEKPSDLAHFRRLAYAFDGLSPCCLECFKSKAAGKRAENTDLHREWYAENREGVLERRRAKGKTPEGREKARQQWRQWYRRYAEKNPHHFAAISQKRRAMKAQSGGSFTAKDVAAMKAAQRGRCWWCQVKLTRFEVDHRIPLSKGGSNEPANLVLACAPCNRRKAAKMPWELAEPRLL